MKYIYFIIMLLISNLSVASDATLIQGYWKSFARSFLSSAFEIDSNHIRFVYQACLNNTFEIVESFDDTREDWSLFDHKKGDFYNFVLKIHYENSPGCREFHSDYSYIRMSLPKVNPKGSSTYFYNDEYSLNKDKSDGWIGGQSSWGYFSKQNVNYSATKHATLAQASEPIIIKGETPDDRIAFINDIVDQADARGELEIAYEYLTKALKDPSPKVRARAADGPSGLKLLGPLIEALASDPDRNVRKTAADTLDHWFNDNGAEPCEGSAIVEAHLNNMFKALSDEATHEVSLSILVDILSCTSMSDAHRKLITSKLQKAK